MISNVSDLSGDIKRKARLQFICST